MGSPQPHFGDQELKVGGCPGAEGDALGSRVLSTGLPPLPPLPPTRSAAAPPPSPAVSCDGPRSCFTPVCRLGCPQNSQAGSYGAGSKLRAHSLREQLAQSITQGTHPVPQHPGAAGPRIFGIGNQGCKEVCQQAEPAPGALALLLPLHCPGPGCRSRPQASQALSHAANL